MPPPLSSRQKITLTVVRWLPPNAIVWDTQIKGFCIRRQIGEAVSYRLKFRVNGRQLFVTIGRHGQPWTPETARQQALKILANPELAVKPLAPPSMSFKEASTQFFSVHGPKLKPRSLEEYQRLNRLYLAPAFDKVPLRNITRAMIAKAHAGWCDSPRTANHALAVLSRIMSWAEDQGYRAEHTNPCRKVQRFSESKRDFFLTANQLAHLNQALNQAEADHVVGPFPIAAIRLLLLTGARLSEILTLQWAWVDADRRMIFLPDSKTGQKPIILNAAAMAVLQAIPRLAGNPYVIAGHKTGEHLVNLQKPWRAVRALAGLDHVRIHDLRHTFASFAVAQGGSLPHIGKVLGHSQPQTTQRYAHLSEDPVRQLTQLTGEALDAALKGKPD